MIFGVDIVFAQMQAMKNQIPFFLRISVSSVVLVTAYACTAAYPPTIYDGATRRLSDYENNYYIKVPLHYTYVHSIKELAPVLSEHIQAMDDKTALFNKGKQVTAGMFRWHKEVDPFAWFEIIDATKQNNPPSADHPLIQDIISQFAFGPLQSVKLTTHNNFLVIDPRMGSESTHNKLKFAVQPYATFKGGRRNSLFIAFILYAPSVTENQVQQDFEVLLENTALSYFLNYERTLEKTLTFN